MDRPVVNALFAESALLPAGWARDVLFEIGADGTLTSVTPNVPAERARGVQRVAGPIVPGMPNLHSHAFQRAMAGLAERLGQAGAAPEGDSFWTWRQVMYGFVGRLDPPHLEAIAAQLYVEMLKAGYTAVGEFHYLHHDRDGVPYGDPAEMSERIVAAARESGIGLTLLPVLYANGGFGGQEPNPGQSRFVHDAESFLDLHSTLLTRFQDDAQIRIGIAPHSLRAVTPELLTKVNSELNDTDILAPRHIHIAEQTKEVEECLAWSGRRPIEWLLDNFPLDPLWCLVHATHMSEFEIERLAKTDAIIGLCPTTEANLGDGMFPAAEYLNERGGRFGIGSDSHISVSPFEELRWLEYGQRLLHRRRNVLARANGSRDASRSVGAVLYRGALDGGKVALGRDIGELCEGARADLVVLDTERANLIGKEEDVLLDAAIFAGNENPVRDVMVGGRWVVQEGHHPAEHAILARFRRALADLSA